MIKEQNLIALGELYGGCSNLMCPRCGGDYTHQGRVSVFDRREDAELVSVTVVEDGLSATHLRPSNGSGNPSARRHAVTIKFYCELCDDPFELVIAQHKGVSLVSWRYEERQQK